MIYVTGLKDKLMVKKQNNIHIEIIKIYSDSNVLTLIGDSILDENIFTTLKNEFEFTNGILSLFGRVLVFSTNNSSDIKLLTSYATKYLKMSVKNIE